ncbi:MAG: ATP-binding protein [Desulfobacterales bacterium]|nr:ATP-binding protein [Desulfobacterales bacterium]
MTTPTQINRHNHHQALCTALDDLRHRMTEREKYKTEKASVSSAPMSAKTAGEDRVGSDAGPERSAGVGHDTLLQRLAAKFGLTDFERDLLLLCAGVAFDARFTELMGRLQGEGHPQHPTFSLALSVLGDPHWRALSPEGPLRRGRLLALGRGSVLVTRPLYIEEAVLHYLTGMPQLDRRLHPYVESLAVDQAVTNSQIVTARQMVSGWKHHDAGGRRRKVLLSGSTPSDQRAVFAAACASIRFAPYALETANLPIDRDALEAILSLWERDAVMHDLALLVDAQAGIGQSEESRLRWMLNRLEGIVAFTSEGPVPALAAPVLPLAVAAATPAEQSHLWIHALGPLAQQLNGQVGRLVQQFSLSSTAIAEVAAELQTIAVDASAETISRQLWKTCRRKARGGLESLAQRLDSCAEWDDLILPRAQKETLRNIAIQVRQRSKVYERWGFAEKRNRGFGIGALFWGPSGAGKTMAAEVLAQDLGLDLYRIDLSAVVSKYIGETEKNLCRLFDAAEMSGAVLLFDESDALFGKRSEVKDSHDRYANLEISYLLQRMESYRGLALLTTNIKSALDSAFLRRLRFIVQFPFPSSTERKAIWKGIFPLQTPVQNLDFEKLARLSVTGGHIANIALDAAFRAAEQGCPVSMAHLLKSAGAEYAKMEKPLSDTEIRGWV